MIAGTLPISAGDSMTQENSEGAAYLRALRQSQDRPAETDLSTQTSERFAGAEKRRSFRHKCEGSVEIRKDGCDVRTWATFTDISLHGCYVEAQATFPPGTLLNLKLESNGVRVETKGDVRVNYPYLGMGMAFIEMSEENQTRLRQLLATISNPRAIVGGEMPPPPAPGPTNLLAPFITDPIAALQALIQYFEGRQKLMREDFLRILQKSQSGESKR